MKPHRKGFPLTVEVTNRIKETNSLGSLCIKIVEWYGTSLIECDNDRYSILKRKIENDKMSIQNSGFVLLSNTIKIFQSTPKTQRA